MILNSEDFHHYGDLTYHPNEKWIIKRFIYNPNSGFEKEELKERIYVWAIPKPKEEIIYVGRCSKTVKQRHNEHRQGFKGPEYNGSRAGGRKREFLESLFESKNPPSKIEVWAKVVNNSRKEEAKLISKLSAKRNNWIVLNAY